MGPGRRLAALLLDVVILALCAAASSPGDALELCLAPVRPVRSSQLGAPAVVYLENHSGRHLVLSSVDSTGALLERYIARASLTTWFLSFEGQAWRAEPLKDGIDV